MDLILSITGGIALAYIIIVLTGRFKLSKQKASKRVVYGATTRKGENSVENIGETVIAVLNREE